MRILVAGAAGRIGRIVASGLNERGHQIRGLDLAPAPTEHCSLGAVTGDCTDAAAVGEAVTGVEAVVHLAGRPSESALPEEIDSHRVTAATLLNAMVEAGCAESCTPAAITSSACTIWWNSLE